LGCVLVVIVAVWLVTPEQCEKAKPLIADVIAKRRRERFKVVRRKRQG
jgi:hypothetical protein